MFENVGQMSIKIVRDGPLNCEVAVHVKTEDGTANSGSDFIEIDEDVHFAPGEDAKEVRVFSYLKKRRKMNRIFFFFETIFTAS